MNFEPLQVRELSSCLEGAGLAESTYSFQESKSGKLAECAARKGAEMGRLSEGK